MKLDSLEGLKDDELQQVVARANELLDARKQQKRQEAMEQARATLAAAGLTVDDLRRSSKKSGKNAPVYRSGARYQHPDHPEKVWAGKGKKPHWLRDLEKKGGKAVELG